MSPSCCAITPVNWWSTPVFPTACTTKPIGSLSISVSNRIVIMPRSEASAAVSIERFFQYSLLGLVACGYLAVAGSGYLDSPTIILTAAGLLLRGLLIGGFLSFQISERMATILAVSYIG